MEIETILCLPQGNRRVTVFLDCETEDELISQCFVKQNGLQATFVKRMGIAVDGHRVTIYGSYNLLIKVKDHYNVTQSTERTLCATDMQYYDLIFGISQLDKINLNV